MEIDWYDKNALWALHRREETGPLFRAMRRRRPIIVGPEHIAPLTPVLNISRHIITPKPNALEAIDRLTVELAEAVHAGALVCLSAAFAAKVLIWRLWPECRAQHVSLLDTGSLFDGLVGVYSRTSRRRSDWPEKAARILTEMTN